MCGYYRLSRRKQIVGEYFDSVSEEPDWTPRYNITPTRRSPMRVQYVPLFAIVRNCLYEAPIRAINYPTPFLSSRSRRSTRAFFFLGCERLVRSLTA